VYALNRRDGVTPSSGYIYDKVKRTADHFVDATNMSNAELAELIVRDKISILVNLFGHTGKVQANPVFIMQPAPVQLLHNGFLGTFGAEQIVQYYTTDRVLSPDHLAEQQGISHASSA
jgi:predicted O-linked N-acetylglucosamine transferase (SPINDLY family)